MASRHDALETTLGLFGTGLELMRQNLRRAHPQANEDEIDRWLRQWLHARPGAESGDCPRPPVDMRAQRR